MPDTRTPIDVFVSYATPDRERVRPLVDALLEAELNVWWDRSIAPGAEFDTEIQQALDNARCVLVVWSRESIQSEWVITEASEGLERGILVPVGIDVVRPPLAFRRRQTIDATQQKTAGRDVLAAVQAVLQGGDSEFRSLSRTMRRRSIGIGLAINIVVAVALALTLVNAWHVDAPAPVGAPIRVPLALDGWGSWKDVVHPVPSLALSSDGDMLAYVSRDDSGTPALVIRHLAELTTVKLRGTEGASNPFFSPTGDWVGFFDDGLLKRVPVHGGEPSTVAQVSPADSWGASWGADDRIVYATGRSGLQSVSLLGTEVRTVTELDASRDEGSHRLPHHVLGYPLLLFTVMIEAGQFKHEVWVLNLATGERHYLFDGLAPAYVSTGHVVFAKGGRGADRGALWAVAFDPERGQVTGPAQVIQGAVGGREGSGYAIAYAGPMVYVPSQGQRRGSLRLRAPDGELQILTQGAQYDTPRFSTDGQQLAVTLVKDAFKPSILLVEIGTGASRTLEEVGLGALWTSGDASITFMKPGTGLVRRRVDDTETRETLVAHTQNIFASAWVQGGEGLLYSTVDPETVGNLYLTQPGREPRHIFGRGAVGARVSPDGRWLALCTWPAGILVGPFPDFASTSVASERGCFPSWSADARRLYYQDFDKLRAVDVAIGRGVSFGEHRLIADLGLPGRALYDVGLSGRIVFAHHAYDAPSPPVLVVNWSAGLH